MRWPFAWTISLGARGRKKFGDGGERNGGGPGAQNEMVRAGGGGSGKRRRRHRFGEGDGQIVEQLAVLLRRQREADDDRGRASPS